MKKTMTEIGLAILCCLAVTAGTVLAGSVWGDYDSASPLLVRYTDDSAVGTIAVAAGAVTITDDGNANTHTFETDGATLADLYSAITGATNASGKMNFEAVYWAGLAADLVTNSYVVTASATTLTKQWSYMLKWDTSNCKHYDVAGGIMSPYKSPIGGYSIDGIFGSPDGTGNVTLSLYVDGSRRYARVYTSPTYAYDSGTNLVADAGVYPAVDFTTGIHIGAYQRAFVRATRATTATTGGIGFTFK